MARGRKAFKGPSLGVTLGGAAILIILLAAFAAPLPHDPLQPDTDSTLAAPTGDHWFGTDSLGRDIFSRVIAGVRLDLPLALAGMLLSLGIGVPLGLVASTKSKWSERLMRGLDMFQAFPLLVLAIVVVALAGNNLGNIVIALAFINTPRFIRIVRSDALALRERRFVEAAVAIGASRFRVLTRHVLPNVSGTVLVQASLAAAQAMVVIAALSFLGIGIKPPTASLGAMIQTGSSNLVTGQWWVSVFPGLAVGVIVLCFNQIADGLDTILGRGAHG